MSASHTNRLIQESSPYLLQHANNPVDWYPWGDEALQKAKTENKPILVSIGYAACHWCHVMERESFENETVAEFMNAHFINIKIDREERPDLDHIYMDAVQTMTGSGGWPLNVFLTTDAEPFYGGTYFPPVKMHNRGSWTDVLQAIHIAWQERPGEIKDQAAQLTGHLKKSNAFAVHADTEHAITNNREQADAIFEQIMKLADKEWGGFGRAPKFPQFFTIQFLLLYHHATANEGALGQAILSIDKLLEGGIYDQVGGGLARYSTDNEWLAPHFEKMLYDNALLIQILSEAFQITGNREYERAIRKTIGFLEREMMHPEGGFYAALDADSEGEEGKFYVWQLAEIEEELQGDSALFCEFFDVSAKGNWEGKNILRILKKLFDFANEKGLDPVLFEKKIDECLDKLFVARTKRIRPILDDKILLGWNAMMITALCKASAALNDSGYAALAKKSIEFLFKQLSKDGSGTDFFHTYKNGQAKYPAFLDDYACLIQACIHYQEISSSLQYLDHAQALTSHVLDNFSDDESGFFFFTNSNQFDVIVRKLEYYDGATPSGNSIMAGNLFYLSRVYDRPIWEKTADQMLNTLKNAVIKYPGSFGVWASILLKQWMGINELVITGLKTEGIRAQIMQQYIPNSIVLSSCKPVSGFPLLESKRFETAGLLYLCRDYTCKAPVHTVKELLLEIQKRVEI